MSKQLVLDVFNNKETERIPVGFWFHFAPTSDFTKAPGNPDLFRRTVEGHKEYFRRVGSDILKIMTEGYFVLPSLRGVNIADPEQLNRIEPVDQNDPWVTEQIELAKQLTDAVGQEAAVFYTLFSPTAYLAYSQIPNGTWARDPVFAKLVKEAPEALTHALNVISKDVTEIGKRILWEAGVDGLFLAVRNYQDISSSEYEKILAPGEKYILTETAKISDYNILHICGGFSVKNDYSIYQKYDAKAINWASQIEGMPLKKGRKIFGDRAVIGGFDNRSGSILFNGSREELEAKTQAIVADAGRRGVVIGADCALPTASVDYERLSWVKQKADSL